MKTITIMSRCHEYTGEWVPERGSLEEVSRRKAKRKERYEAPMNWTADERRRLAELRKNMAL